MKYSERLENMSPIGFDLNGDVLLKSEDYHWLMEQAERYEDLLEQVKQIEKVSDYNADLRMRYKQALQEIDNEAETAIHYGFTSLKDFCYRLRKQIEKAMEGEK